MKIIGWCLKFIKSLIVSQKMNFLVYQARLEEQWFLCQQILLKVVEEKVMLMGKISPLELKRFLVIAHGSATEVEYLLFLSNELNFITNKEYLELNERIIILRKQLHKLIIKIKANS